MLDTALRARKDSVTLLQSGVDNFALIAPVRSIEALAHEGQSVEVHNPPEDTLEVVFLSAGQSATREFLVWLKQVRIRAQSPLLLAATNAVSFGSLTLPDGLGIRSTDGTIAVKGAEGRVEFSVYLLSLQNATDSPRFEPVKKPIGEAPGNLRQRSEWFTRRSGR